MRKKKQLDRINFDLYEFDAEKGLIWSKYFKKWLTGRKSYVKGNKDDYYLAVELKNKDGSKDFYQYHRVIAYLFCERPENLKDVPYEELEINHKNEIKYDNKASNLEWCDRQYNINYGTCPIKRSETNKKIVHTKEWNDKVSKTIIRKPIVRVLDDGTIEKYNSLTDAAKNLNLKTAGLICSCCQNRNHMEKKLKSHRRAYKSEWYYKDDYEKLIIITPTLIE